MRSITPVCRAVVVAILVVGCLPAGLPAQEVKPTKNAIDEESKKTLARYVEFIGGNAALKKHQSCIRRGKIDINNGGMTGDLTVWQKPGKFLSHFELEDFGTIERGSNGKTVWSIHPNDGPSVLTGVEKQEIQYSYALINPAIQWNATEFMGTITSDGQETLGGRKTKKITFKPTVGSPTIRFFDAETGGLRRMVTTRTIGSGAKLKLEVLYSDYRKFDSLGFALKQQYKLEDGHSYQITMTSFELGATIPDDKFSLPKQIMQLLEKK